MKTFETNVYIMTIHDDQLVEFKVKKNKTLTEEDIWQSTFQARNYMPGKKFFTLLETEENFSVTVGAKRAGASEEYAKTTQAVALFSRRLHESIIGNLYLKLNKPRVNTKFFDDRNKAIEWLREQIAKN